MFYSEFLDLGTLDTSIYKCITDEIATDRVAITSRQLLHIADRHPDAYDDIRQCLQESLHDPDYIFRDRGHEYTGLVVHRLPHSDESLYIVLRICTYSNPDINANTIISGWKISANRLQRYLRSEQVIYTRSPTC